MTSFNEITFSDHRGLCIYLPGEALLKNLEITIPSSFKRKLQSSPPLAVLKLKKPQEAHHEATHWRESK